MTNLQIMSRVVVLRLLGSRAYARIVATVPLVAGATKYLGIQHHIRYHILIILGSYIQHTRMNRTPMVICNFQTDTLYNVPERDTGMTWKEFKDKVESQSVTDDTKIRYIDVSDGYPEVEVTEEEKGIKSATK